tara:strand:+ start:2352 stop:3041 length:690 start_codon:yes stop_codon:yes gene_type:complete
MATFVQGDWVEVVPRPDYSWEHWSEDNTAQCGKTGKITRIMEGDWVDEIYVEVEYRGDRAWFSDHHLIKVEKYEEIFKEAIHKACDQLQQHEKICKKLRDEILHEVFGDETMEMEEVVEPPPPETDDQFFNDWEEVTTKEVIPLPGNGGTMTTPTDPKAQANSRRKKVRKIKSLGNKKVIKKDASKNLTDSWTLSDEEIRDLEDYLDSLPNSGIPNQSGDYDYEYDEFD